MREAVEYRARFDRKAEFADSRMGPLLGKEDNSLWKYSQNCIV